MTESTVAARTPPLWAVRRRGDLQRLEGTPGEAPDQQVTHSVSLPLQLCNCYHHKKTGLRRFFETQASLLHLWATGFWGARKQEGLDCFWTPCFSSPSLYPPPPSLPFHLFKTNKNAGRLAKTVLHCFLPLLKPPSSDMSPRRKAASKKGSKLPCLSHDKHQRGSLHSAILDLPVSVAGRVTDTKGTSATQSGHCLPRGSPLGQTTWSEPLTAWLADCTHHMPQCVIINRKWYEGCEFQSRTTYLELIIMYHLMPNSWYRIEYCQIFSSCLCKSEVWLHLCKWGTHTYTQTVSLSPCCYFYCYNTVSTIHMPILTHWGF